MPQLDKPKHRILELLAKAFIALLAVGIRSDRGP
jgi:hypothetical protein